MMATHNIKVNGRWYRAGEEYQIEEQKPIETATEQLEEETAPVTDPEPAKPKSPSRRKAKPKDQ